MVDDADLNVILAYGFNVVVNAVQHPLKIGGVVWAASIIVINNLLILVIANSFGVSPPSRDHQDRAQESSYKQFHSVLPYDISITPEPENVSDR